MTRRRVLVVYKKTTLQRIGDDDGRIQKLLAEDDPSVANLQSGHEAHLDTLERARVAFKRLDVKATFRHRHEKDGEQWDMVVTLGGDGTLLWASHTVDANTPMLAINSAPETSVGYFCAGDRASVEETLAAALAGELKPTKLTRMEVQVDGEVLSTRVLNDILFCHECPAAATRYIMRHDGREETHVCSGVWVGPAAGSTAAQKSAGGKVLPIGSRRLQWVVREPYLSGDDSLALAKGVVAPDTELRIKSKIRAGRIYFDGAQKVARVDIGSELLLRRSPEKLILLGLRSH